MPPTISTTSATDDGISLQEWMKRMEPLDLATRYAEAVGVVVLTPGGKIDASVILSDSSLYGRFDRDCIGNRLRQMYGGDARVIYPDIENGAVKHPFATPIEDIPEEELPY